MSITPIFLTIGTPMGIAAWDDVNNIGNPYGEWIGGPYPYLDTADGSGSYVIYREALYLAVRLPPFNPGETFTVAYQIRFNFVGLNFPGFRFFDASLPFNVDSGPGYLGRVTTFPDGALQETESSWTYGEADYDPDNPGPRLVTPEMRAAALRGDLIVARAVSLNNSQFSMLTLLDISAPTVEGILAIDTHDHPFHVVGTRDPAMPYELVIDTGTERLVEIVAGEETLATHELVIDETGRPGTPWSHCGLFRPV